MNRGSLVLGGALGLSLLFNALAVVRLSRADGRPAPRPSAPAPSRERAPERRS